MSSVAADGRIPLGVVVAIPVPPPQKGPLPPSRPAPAYRLRHTGQRPEAAGSRRGGRPLVRSEGHGTPPWPCPDCPNLPRVDVDAR
ncbi:hypothetical protein MRX96_054380 [Rhipicephalus microplus]